MPKRGPKPKGKVKIEWTSDFAYGLGLIATDGCLYSDGIHISFGSKDLDQVHNFIKCFTLDNKIGKNLAGHKKSHSFRVQFGDVIFYRFLISIGIGPAKSKTIGRIIIPDELFFDFLRGVFDGDGYVHSYFDKRWEKSFLWYMGFCSASQKFLDWIRKELKNRLGVIGHVTSWKGGSCLQLKYAKTEAFKISKKLYPDEHGIHLSRKKLKLRKILAIVGKSPKRF